MAESWNVFLIGRRRDHEDQLTEMLVWLASAVPAVATSIVQLALGGSELGMTGLQISTQHGIAAGRLDAFFTSPELALIVESKLKSDYGEDQLRKYLDWLDSEQRTRPTRALMTLTARSAPWPALDLEHAVSLGIASAAHLWEELHELLSPLADEGGQDPLSARLVREFLEMLTEEDLVPIRPLAEDELGDAWSRSREVIRRYHEFFRASKGAIAEQLAAQPSSNSLSENRDYIWQDFICEDGARIAVGLHYSAADHLVDGRKTSERSPILWLAVLAEDWPDWDALVPRLEAQPPQGWQLQPKRWWGRPNIWRTLPAVIGAGTFEEQRDRIAEAAVQGRLWLDSTREGGPGTAAPAAIS